MITKEQIESWIEIYHKDTHSNKQDVMKDAYFGKIGGIKTLKLTLIDAKTLIDRHGDRMTTDIVVHSSKKEWVRSELNKTGHLNIADKHHNGSDTIWAAVIHYSDDCPKEYGVMVSLDGELDGKSVVVFPID